MARCILDIQPPFVLKNQREARELNRKFGGIPSIVARKRETTPMGNIKGIPGSAMNEANDPDPAETGEWLDALAAVVRERGGERARYVLNRLEAQGQKLGLIPQPQPQLLPLIFGLLTPTFIFIQMKDFFWGLS